MDSSKKHHNPNPKATANPISKLFLWWTRKIFYKGYRRELEEADLYNPLLEDQSGLLGDRLEATWKAEVLRAKARGRTPSLLRAIFAAFWLRYLFFGMVLGVQCLVIRIAQPLLLGRLIQYFNEDSGISETEAFATAGGMVATVYFLICFQHHYTMGTALIGMRVRVACCSLLYRKVLRLSRASMDQTATGQIVNLMSNDVSRFDQAPNYLHWFWISVIQVPLVTYCLWRYVGLAALIGFVFIFIITIPIQGLLGRVTSVLRKRIAVRTDERMRLMNEIVSGIAVIKMYAWEIPFAKMVSMARKNEIDQVTRMSYVRGYYLSSLVFVERSSLFVTLMSYTLLGNTISAYKVFAMAQFYNVLNQTMASFYSLAVANAAETYVTVQRLQSFLLLDETAPGEVAAPPPPPSAPAHVPPLVLRDGGDGALKEKAALAVAAPAGAVALAGLRARWGGSTADTLAGVSVAVQPGKLCAIIGPVGSGKSSLLHALLGELPLRAGACTVGGSVAYASQEPWIFVGSVRQNILFGRPYCPERYKEVVRVCALRRDFELLPYGDRTLVGEKGISLSGGQRARINLARAVYQSADVYLLDDPLSAVDTHVGKQLFDDCINGYLAGKTRILVTHQLQYLQNADHIVMFKDGRVAMQGPFRALASSGLDFAALLGSECDEKELQAELAAEAVADPAASPFERALRASVRASQRRRSSTQRERRDSTRSNASARPVGEEEENLALQRGPVENKEERIHGGISWRAYWQYIRAGGSVPFLLLVAGAFLIAQVATSGSDYWVTYWTREENQRRLLRELAAKNALARNATVAAASARGAVPAAADVDIPAAPLFSTTTSIYIYGCVVLGCLVLTVARSMLFYKMCMNASMRLHDRMFAAILRGAMRFFDTNPSGRILNRFSKDVGAIDELLPRALLEALQIFMVGSGILTMVLVVNYWLLLPMLVIGTLFYLISVVFLATARNVKRLEGVTRSPVFTHLSDSLSGLVTIRSSGQEAVLRKEFDLHQDLHTSAWFHYIATSTAFGFWLDILSAIFVTLVTFSFLVLGGDTLGGANVGLAISQSLILCVMLQHGILQTTEVVSQMTSVERVLEYTNVEQEPPLESDPNEKPSDAWPERGRIEFERVSLTYCEGEAPVLRDLDFVIEPRHKVGVVGRTGAGKSSLLAALFRLAWGRDGRVLIDGVDTARVGLHDLRRRISIIPQEPVLFSATLRQNLDPFGDFPDDALWSALEEVELKGSVESLEMRVSEGGSNFSVGQRQLVCLARAILRNNRILVLDEATANVDPQTDALIQSTIRRKFADCTVLTIAHRLHTIMDSDRVLVMDAGTVAEFDHPWRLLQRQRGVFSHLVEETGPLAATLARTAEQEYLRVHPEEVPLKEEDGESTRL